MKKRSKFNEFISSWQETCLLSLHFVVSQILITLYFCSFSISIFCSVIIWYTICFLFLDFEYVFVWPYNKRNAADNRAGPSNLGNVISQILLCKQITPDFNEEELCSITKDSQEIAMLLSQMQEFMPQQDTYLGMYCFNIVLSITSVFSNKIFLNKLSWLSKSLSPSDELTNQSVYSMVPICLWKVVLKSVWVISFHSSYNNRLYKYHFYLNLLSLVIICVLFLFKLRYNEFHPGKFLQWKFIYFPCFLFFYFLHFMC